MAKSPNNDYTLSLEGAAELLGKSVRTVQRYVKIRKLSQRYVVGPKGDEARLSKSEVIQLARKMVSGIGANPVNAENAKESGSATKAGTDPIKLNIMELLKRHEQAMYRIGQLEEKTQQFLTLEAAAQSLTARHDELAQKDELQRRTIANLEHKVSRLQRELSRPLSATERLTGKRTPQLKP